MVASVVFSVACPLMPERLRLVVENRFPLLCRYMHYGSTVAIHHVWKLCVSTLSHCSSDSV